MAEPEIKAIRARLAAHPRPASLAIGECVPRASRPSMFFPPTMCPAQMIVTGKGTSPDVIERKFVAQALRQWCPQCSGLPDQNATKGV